MSRRGARTTDVVDSTSLHLYRRVPAFALLSGKNARARLSVHHPKTPFHLIIIIIIINIIAAHWEALAIRSVTAITRRPTIDLENAKSAL